MTLLIDNYDSFSYNLVQLAGGINPDIRVIRNDAMSTEEVDALNPSHIILSPGPGYPDDAGICEDVVKRLGDKYPILGVCLGHQAICRVYGAKISHARKLMHGKKCKVFLDTQCPIFSGLPEVIEGARYNSLGADRHTIPTVLEVIARDDMGEVMAVRHRELNIFGLQFHPESVLTPQGETIIKNFLEIGGSNR